MKTRQILRRGTGNFFLKDISKLHGFVQKFSLNESDGLVTTVKFETFFYSSLRRGNGRFSAAMDIYTGK
jgi:hypothetical protein